MDDPFVEIMGPLAVLRARIEETFAQHGLKVIHVGVVPEVVSDGPHEVQILATLADRPPETKDEEFDQLIQGARQAETDQRADAVLRDLQKGVRGSNGFLAPEKDTG